MVEASVGGSCRCACQEDFVNSPEEEEEDPHSACCSPQVFTSVLLGVLACVLMTGGVFLAFHRWDPLWLIVSGIGVVLILIGSVLHCCSNSDSSSRTRGGRHPGKGGCCGRPVQSDHHHHLHGHLVANNGSLTEQLLPLSNARSVSQLSLNMLPGYFPPVVTTYGIEQHSAVVQNINRIVQQQQLQQQQLQQQSPGPNSPGAQSGAGGKSFILLSLPGDTTQANIQNLVATVYQLEGSSATETPAAEATPTPPPATASAPSSPIAASVPTTPVPLLFKSVEVQTCNIWPNAASGSGITNNALQHTASASTSTEFAAADTQQPSTSAVTQTEDATIVEDINLMDCLDDIPQICDNPRSQACGDQSSENTSALANIPASSVLVDISESAIHNNVRPNLQSTATYISESAIPNNVCPNLQSPTTYSSESAIQPLQSALVVTIPESVDESLLDLATPPTTDVLVEVEERTASCSADVSQVSSDVLIDIGDMATSSEPSETVSNTTPSSDIVVSVNLDSVENTNSDVQAGVSNVANASNHLRVGVSDSELSLSNLSDIDGEVDDSELLGRSSPPPSYDDATHEGENAIGAFGLAYGTI